METKMETTKTIESAAQTSASNLLSL